MGKIRERRPNKGVKTVNFKGKKEKFFGIGLERSKMSRKLQVGKDVVPEADKGVEERY